MKRGFLKLAEGEERVNFSGGSEVCAVLTRSELDNLKLNLMLAYYAGCGRDLIRGIFCCYQCKERILMPNGDTVLEGTIVLSFDDVSYVFWTDWFHIDKHQNCRVKVKQYEALREKGVFSGILDQFKDVETPDFSAPV